MRANIIARLAALEGSTSEPDAGAPIPYRVYTIAAGGKRVYCPPDADDLALEQRYTPKHLTTIFEHLRDT